MSLNPGPPKTARELVEEAMAIVRTVDVAQARAQHEAGEALFVDLRDVRELEREGIIAGALHAPRGLLEFWVDPTSAYFNKAFEGVQAGRPMVLFCAVGWRSALAAKTLMEMGFADVAHIGGGFTAWKTAGAPVAEKATPQPKPPALVHGDRPAMLDLPQSLRIQARANRLANHRLHATMAALSPAELHAPRVSFFPSLMATLNHILGVDIYYVAALAGDPDPEAAWRSFHAATGLPDLAAAQRTSDKRLIDVCNRLDAAACERIVDLPRGEGRIQRERAAHVLAHLFAHQVHHRGQVHAMLSGTSVKPPQLDEFLMPSEGHLRAAEMAALGWDETAVYGDPPPP
jgi:uncharacterized damage-inducible protein DinB/rhodanese-related sulfurtransferase